MKKQILPNFFIVGAAKAGTTFLYHYLKQHPDIYMSAVKEPHFFADIDINEKIKRRYFFKWDDYLKLFKGVTNEKNIGEASVSYLCYEEAAWNIRKVIPDAKIIIVLRNPVDRLFSHFLMDIRDGKLPSDANFIGTIKKDYYSIGKKGWGHTHLFVECGIYYHQVKRYLDLFGWENVCISFFDDLKMDRVRFVKNILRFLDADDTWIPKLRVKSNVFARPRNKILQSIYSNIFIKDIGRKVVPDSMKESVVSIFLKKVAKPRITKEERDFLVNLYIRDISNLEKLLDKDLSQWYEE